MKKFVKMSLIAAIAVAGTTASAQPLTEAIKNVDVSGTMVYRYNDYQFDKPKGDSSKTTNYYKIGLNLKSKVNDDVTANTRFVIGSQDNAASFGALSTQSNSDTNLDVELTNANFAYTGIANTTVIVGKQGLTTPWTVAVDATGNEQTGTGILALSTVGPVTIAAAYFNQTNLGQSGDTLSDGTDSFTTTGGNTVSFFSDGDIGSKDVYTVGVMGNVGPVALDAWYIDMEDQFDSYTLGASTSFDIDAVTLGGNIRYTSLDLDNSSADNNMLQATVTAKVGIFDAKVAYATTDDEGGLAALDADATTSISAWTVDAHNKADADYWQVRLGFQVLPSLNISANYADVDYQDGADDMEEEEYYAQLNYSMSKNLSAYIRYGQYTVDTGSTETTDSTRGRINIQYKF